MACGCGGTSARSAAGQQQQQQSAGQSAYVYEVTYNSGDTARFSTESEAMTALSFKGGGYRMVPR